MTDHELDALLTPPPAEKPDPSARAETLVVTTQALRRPRTWARRGLSAAAVFAAGVGVGWFARPVPVPVYHTEIVTVPVPVPRDEPPPGSPGTLVALPHPDALETQAEVADPPTAVRLYRQAADLYLKQNDLANAARCYRLHLAEAGRDELAPTMDDSWLLLVMKSSTRKENDP